MNDISSTLPDRQALLQFILDNCKLDMPAGEAAGKTLAQLGIDSLELLELAIEMDGTYQLSLEVNELGAETTLSDLVENLLRSAT